MTGGIQNNGTVNAGKCWHPQSGLLAMPADASAASMGVAPVRPAVGFGYLGWVTVVIRGCGFLVRRFSAPLRLPAGCGF